MTPIGLLAAVLILLLIAIELTGRDTRRPM